MSVWRRFHDHPFPSIVTTNTSGRRSLFADERAVAMLLAVIREVREETRLCLHAYVIMPDHIHLVLTPSVGVRIGRTMQLIKGRFANRFNRATGGIGSLWQERYHERALRSEKALNAAIEYVHYNPVAAGLCESAEDYRWSSAGVVAVRNRTRSG